MNAWILTCNPNKFDLEAFRRDGHELRSWSVGRFRDELAAGDPFALWLTGSASAVVAYGHIAGPPALDASADASYWSEDPGVRWYVPLVVEEWLERPISRSRFLDDPRFAGSSLQKQSFAANPHVATPAQWAVIIEALEHARDEDPGWDLRPGDTIRRVDLHERYGGSSQNGISTSRRSPNVLIFTDPRSGHQHGYYDEWAEDGTFHYTGEGQKGDQVFTKGNKAIRDYRLTGDRLRLFEGARGTVRYVGEVVLDDVTPFSYGQAPPTGGGPLRQVIRFHMVPIGTTPQHRDAPVGTGYRPADESVVPAPQQPGTPDPDLTGRNLKAHRRLQNSLAESAGKYGLSVLSPNAIDPDFDLAWRDHSGDLSVCEVKSLTESNEVRQLRVGLGQVLDYQDQLQARGEKVRAVLWVERQPLDPRWLGLCRRVGVVLAWPGQEVGLFDGGSRPG
ncbi:hypothetical protein [Streptomyces sp. NBC_00038]|uniref:hypothetical protein n=1 Tax=Streptomyces sp. NBC_00038 TaxID=2903615 RepID=UPI002258F83A|nr:hypothetical protein [Streptomyces sp. NBC_00038]MCX5559954.1 EVE domain-containing protein [Streptomyces sp. NBC_00038]